MEYNQLVPMVIESSPRGERVYDIFSFIERENNFCIRTD